MHRDPPFDDAAEQEVRRVVEAFEPAFRSLDPDYPKGCCVGACHALRGYLTLRLSEKNLWYGNLVVAEGWCRGEVHTWLGTPEGIIIDPTAGQFFGGPALRIVRPTEPDYEQYAVRL